MDVVDHVGHALCSIAKAKNKGHGKYADGQRFIDSSW